MNSLFEFWMNESVSVSVSMRTCYLVRVLSWSSKFLATNMIILDVHHALIVTFFTSQLCQVVFHIAEWIQSNSAVDLQIFASCLVEGRRHGYYYHLVASSIARPSLAIALGTDCWSWRVRNWHYSNPTKAITPCFMNICLQALFHFPVDSLVDMYCIF